jgi:hypothetical protein
MRRVVVYPGRIAVEQADIPAPGPNASHRHRDRGPLAFLPRQEIT